MVRKVRLIKIIVIVLVAVLVGCASSRGPTSVPQVQISRPMFEQMPGNFSNPPGTPEAEPTSAPEASQ
jgi:hypothetical protein